MKGFFVAGTDGGVGKSVVSAALMHRLRRNVDPVFCRAVSNGSERADQDLAGLSGAAPTHLLQEPPGPTDSQAILRFLLARGSGRWCVVEGPGGVLTPINDRELVSDLMWWLRLPVILVAHNRSGEINRILLSLEAMKGRGIGVIGVVLRGRASADDIALIEGHGHVAMLGLLPELEPLTAATVREWSLSELDPRGIIEGFVR